jgi:hypothetical protein
VPDSDVIFQSDDGVLFQIHKINLKVSAGSFSLPEFETNDEIIQLPETAQIIKLLFQFCYPNKHPDIEALECNVLTHLTEAAKKYQVVSAMSICQVCMR